MPCVDFAWHGLDFHAARALVAFARLGYYECGVRQVNKEKLLRDKNDIK